MRHVKEAAQLIQENPSLWIAERHVRHIKSFFDGISLSALNSGELIEPKDYDFRDFDAWIHKKFHISSAHAWDEVILLFSTDGYDSFKHFFILKEDFVRTKVYKNHEQATEEPIKTNRMDLHEFLGSIKKRTLLYLPDPSITRLFSLLSGFLWSRNKVCLGETEEFCRFQVWIEIKFRKQLGNIKGIPWWKIIRYASQDDDESLNLFWEMFSQFEQE